MAVAQDRLLSTAIDSYIASMETRGYKDTTMKKKRMNLAMFLASVGNIQTGNVTSRHVDEFFAGRQRRGVSPQSLNNELGNLNHFFAWAARARFLNAMNNPVADRRPFPVQKKKRLQVPAGHFPALLDATSGARDRIVVALGLYLFLRQSEVATLRIQDVRLPERDGEGNLVRAGFVSVTVHKTGDQDDMPICEELEEELHRWFTYYEADSGELQEGWFLSPARHGNRWIGVGQRKLVPVVDDGQMLKPDKKMVNIEDVAKRALERCGYPLRDAVTGKSNMEGIHTLRRSGARALFDDLLEDGYDGALRTVQAMLHHATTTMTERYLQITLDEKRRNERIGGKKMFRTSKPVAENGLGNVIPMRKEA